MAPPPEYQGAPLDWLFPDDPMLDEHRQDRRNLEREEGRQHVSGSDMEADQPFVAERADRRGFTQDQAAAGAVRHHRYRRIEPFNKCKRRMQSF